jgi:5-oxoprolinase (ATP-hydrolysing)
MALAEVVHEALEPSSEIYTSESVPQLRARLAFLQDKVKNQLLEQRFQPNNLCYERYLNMRYQGTDTSLMILEPEDGDFRAAFLEHHLREFTFTVPGRPILVDDIRVRGMAADGTVADDVDLMNQLDAAKKEAVPLDKLKPRDFADIYFEDTKRVRTPVYVLDKLPKASVVPVC